MTVTIEEDDLVVRMQGWERLWALCGELRVPRKSIKAVTWHETAILSGKDIGWRVGTGFPNVLIAGWFYNKLRGRSFLYLPRARYHLTTLEARQVLSLKLMNYPRCNWVHLAYVDERFATRLRTWTNL